MNPWDATYVECVHNQDLAVFLLKSGWMMVDPSLTVGANSFFLMKNWDDFFTIPGLTKRNFDLHPKTYQKKDTTVPPPVIRAPAPSFEDFPPKK